MAQIESIDELRKLRDAEKNTMAQPTDYSAWQKDMEKLDQLGIQGTGSAAGDRALIKQMEMAAQEAAKEAQIQQAQQQNNDQNNKQDQQVKSMSETDNEQNLKATVANATSSQILDNYIRWQMM